MIYRHREVWFDTVTLELSVGEPRVSGGLPVPPIPVRGVSAVQAVVTNQCNLSCGYCNVRLSSDPPSTMNGPVVRRVIEAAGKAPRGRLLMVTGGEPLLFPDITMEILRRTDPPKVLFTNATLLSHGMAKELKHLDVSPVVSMDGMQNPHDGQRCGSWKLVARGLDALKGAGVEFGISTVVNRENSRRIGAEMKAMFERFQPTGMGFNILHWTPSGFDPISGEEYASAMEQVFLTALENNIFTDQIARRISPILTGRYRHSDCSAIEGKTVFHPDGRTSNCISSRSMTDWSGLIPARMGMCSGCHAAGICGGGCAWDGIHLGKGPGPDPRHCIWVKRILDLFMEDVQDHFNTGPVPREMLQSRYGSLVSRGSSPLGGSIGHGP